MTAAPNIKPYYNIDALLPGSSIHYVTQTFNGNKTSITDLVVTVVMDFPFGSDLDEEQRKLEAQCAQLHKAHVAQKAAKENSPENN